MSHCLFSLYAEHIIRNAGLNELQVGIKIVRKNINNLVSAGNMTLMTGNYDELKNLLMKVKEENEKTGLKLNIKKQTNKQTN